MNITNERYEKITLKLNNITFPLKAGTPMDIGGNICNGKVQLELFHIHIKQDFY